VNGSPVVIDASIALHWLLPAPLSGASWSLFERTAKEGNRITAPSLLVYEVVSGLTKAIYLQDLSPDKAYKSLVQLFTLNTQLVDADELLSERALDWTLRLRRTAAYDSYYLALAELLNCQFWTADRKLYNAALEIKLNWVHWVEEAS